MTDYDDNMNDMWADFGRLFENDFEDMNRRLNRMFDSLKSAPGVKTYGYTMYQGPDGVPHYQEFGNTSGDRGLIGSTPFGMIAEPLTDVVEDNGVVRATAEIPGVDKKDIKLDGTANSLTISVDTPRGSSPRPSPCRATWTSRPRRRRTTTASWRSSSSR